MNDLISKVTILFFVTPKRKFTHNSHAKVQEAVTPCSLTTLMDFPLFLTLREHEKPRTLLFSHEL